MFKPNCIVFNLTINQRVGKLGCLLLNKTFMNRPHEIKVYFSYLWYWFDRLCLNISTLRPRQNCRHLADGIFKCILLNENVWISLKISLKFTPKVRINNIPALVQIMAWCRSGDKLLSESMMFSLLLHMRHSASMSSLWPCIQRTREWKHGPTGHLYITWSEALF